MRDLTVRQKSRAAECLGMAFSHYRVANSLIQSGHFAAAISRLYFAASFAARAACIDRCKWSRKHVYWKGQFNKYFGRGQSWVPKTYTKLLDDLYAARQKIDYEGTFPNDQNLASQWEYKVSLLLKKVRGNTPLLHYPQFVEKYFSGDPEILALEFDYYCPKSYIHKERVQFQCMSEKYTDKTPDKLKKAGSKAISILKAARTEDYVVGWNNRLGQSGDGYLLFLDIDEMDEENVRAALQGRRGWLFKTGNGFHFIGARKYDSAAIWRYRYRQAVRSSKLKGIIDKRHYDFSLRRGYSTLRIDRSDAKDFIPFMCWDNSK